MFGRACAFFRRIDWNSPVHHRRAVWLVPVIMGLISVFSGIDTNWDLFNYHLYGPFALLNGKSNIDLAVGSFQGYFNPLLDVPTYILNKYLPAIMVGFLAGTLHGLTFVAILAIARIVTTREEDRFRIPLLLATIGVLTPNFLTSVGNGMGDNSTAVLCLFGFAILVCKWTRLGQTSAVAMLTLLASGLLFGAATGLKLTNGVSAVAACLALLVCYPGSLVTKLRLSFLFGIGVLAGTAATAGYWMWEMWTQFGNPLFPQFGAVFPNELARPTMVADTRWLPKSAMEYLLWPFVFSLDSHRVGEMGVTQILWPAAYILFVGSGLHWIWSRLVNRAMSAGLDPRQLFICLFVVVAYLVWTTVFSIYRYTVTFEMLLPITFWILLTRLFPYDRARVVTVAGLISATVIMFLGGIPSWGHAAWAYSAYRVETMAIPDSDRATVLAVAHPDTRPLGWIATFYPPDLAFFGLANSFPATDAFKSRVQQAAKERGGSVYAVFSAEADKRSQRLKPFSDVADWIGLTSSPASCRHLGGFIGALRLKAVLVYPAERKGGCLLDVPPAWKVDTTVRNKFYMEYARSILIQNSFDLDPGSCRVFNAYVGAFNEPYQLCTATIRSTE